MKTRTEKQVAPSKPPKARTTPLYRIWLSNSKIDSAVLYAHPSNVGYGLQFTSNKADLRDVDANLIFNGVIIVRAQPGAFSMFDLAIFNRVLRGFQGFYALTFQGTYTVTSYAEITLDVIESSDIQQ
jgi:hypothetical protein